MSSRDVNKRKRGRERTQPEQNPAHTKAQSASVPLAHPRPESREGRLTHAIRSIVPRRDVLFLTLRLSLCVNLLGESLVGSRHVVAIAVGWNVVVARGRRRVAGEVASGESVEAWVDGDVDEVVGVRGWV